MLPQDPLLFSGSVRANLDPWEEHSDETIWSALERAQIAPAIHALEPGLEAQVGEGGDQVAEGRPPRVAGEDLGLAHSARRLLLGEHHVAAQPLLGRGLDDLQHDVEGAHVWRRLLGELLEPAQLHARAHATLLGGWRLHHAADRVERLAGRGDRCRLWSGVGVEAF